MKSILLILLIFSFCISSNNSQPVLNWTATYNGTGNGEDKLVAMIADASGNIYVTGYSYANLTEGYDYVTNKYNPNGALIWSMRFNSLFNGNDYPVAITLDGKKNVIVTGKSFRGSEFDTREDSSGDLNNSYDYVTIKYSNSGVQQWLAQYDGGFSGNDEPTAIACDISGNIYVTGFSTGFSTGYDCLTIKYSYYGAEEWVNRYNNNGLNDGGKDIFTDDAGFIYVAGYSKSANISKNDFLSIKYNPSGGSEWTRTYNNGNRDDIACKIKTDGSGNVYIAGNSNSSVDSRPLSIKYDNNGNYQWASFTGNSADLYTALDLILLNSGNAVVLGKNAPMPEISKYQTLKLNSSGNVLQLNNYANCNGFFCENYAADMFIDLNDNIFETGVSNTNTPGNNYNITTIKYNSLGVLEWETFYQGPTTDMPIAVAIDSYGNNSSFYVGGSIKGFGGDYDFLLLNYINNDIDENHKISAIFPEKYALYNNYPNPFNPVTQIRYDIPERVHVNLEVINALGQKINTLVNSVQDPGSYSINFAQNELPSGIYFYMLKAGNFIQTNKMVLLK